jgi:hypothetical protein
MPAYCFFCKSRSGLVLRREESCKDEPVQQWGPGARRTGIYVCPRNECQTKMTPTGNDDIFLEWNKFHFTRRMVTQLRHAGHDAAAAFDLLEASGPDSGTLVDSSIARGLKKAYETPGGRKLYDPEFDDPAFHAGSSAMLLAAGNAQMFFFFLWVMAVRFNRALNNRLVKLWNAPEDDLLELLPKGVLGSITTRANECMDDTQQRIVQLRRYFKSEESRGPSLTFFTALMDGEKSLQTVMQEFTLPADVRPKYFGVCADNYKSIRYSFKVYFLGKVVAHTFSTCRVDDLVGRSLIPENAQEAKCSLQLCDLLSDGISLDGMFSKTAAGLEKRERWQNWALRHFNEVRKKHHLPALDTGLNEHSACEFIRYIRQMLDSGWLDEIPPAVRAKLPTEHMDRAKKSKKQKR